VEELFKHKAELHKLIGELQDALSIDGPYDDYTIAAAMIEGKLVIAACLGETEDDGETGDDGETENDDPDDLFGKGNNPQVILFRARQLGVRINDSLPGAPEASGVF
jgi:hypothetical protein